MVETIDALLTALAGLPLWALAAAVAVFAGRFLAVRTRPEAVTGEQALDRHFPAGAGDPVQVIGGAGAASQLQAAVSSTLGVTAVTRPAVRDGYAYLEGTLTSSADSQASFATIDRLRSTVHAIPGTFAALGSLPVVLATEIGFVVAFGVLLDTFVVRSVLVGALNLDVGRWLWWPSGLSRRPGRQPGRRRGRPDGGAHHLTTTGAMVIVTAQA